MQASSRLCCFNRGIQGYSLFKHTQPHADGCSLITDGGGERRGGTRERTREGASKERRKKEQESGREREWDGESKGRSANGASVLSLSLDNYLGQPETSPGTLNQGAVICACVCAWVTNMGFLPSTTVSCSNLIKAQLLWGPTPSRLHFTLNHLV